MSLDNNVDALSDIISGEIDNTPNAAPVEQQQTAAPTPQTNAENNGGTRQAGSNEKQPSIRDLLTEAAKVQDPNSEGRTRDEQGRFAPKAAADPNIQQQAPVEGQQQQADPFANLPKPNLDESENAALSSVPEAHRQSLFRAIQAREAFAMQQHQRAEQLAQMVGGYDSVARVVESRREAWALQGLTPEAAMNTLFALSDFATRDPAGFIQYYAGQHNIDLSQLNADAIPPDPEITALRAEINNLKQTTQGFGQYQQSQAHAQVNGFIENFASETDPQGNKARPYFDEVQYDMLPLIQAFRQNNPQAHPAQILQAAYERAVWANPSTRAKLQEADNAQRLASEKQRVVTARNAGSSVISSAPASDNIASSVPAGSSVRDALRASFAAHS